MLLSLCQCQLRHINHSTINIATYIISGRRWHDIWRIRWSPTGYWISLQLMGCVMWISGWLLTNRGQLSWINDWIISRSKHRYNRWWQLIPLWVTVIANKCTGYHEECYVKTWMNVDKPSTAEVDLWLNFSMEEKQISPVMTTRFSLSNSRCY